MAASSQEPVVSVNVAAGNDVTGGGDCPDRLRLRDRLQPTNPNPSPTFGESSVVETTRAVSRSATTEVTSAAQD